MKLAVLLTLLLPALAGALAAALPGRAGARASAALAAAGLALGLVLAGAVLASGPLSWPEALLRVDALSALALVTSGGVVAAATLDDALSGVRSRRGAAAIQGLALANACALLFDHTALLWLGGCLALGAAAVLILDEPMGGEEEALGLVLVAGLGLSAALLGSALFFAAAPHEPGAAPAALLLSGLRALAPRLEPAPVRAAAPLVYVGFGALAGLVPLHGPIARAARRSSGAVAALLSVVLADLGLYGILRYRAIAADVPGVGGGSSLLVLLGVASLALATVLLPATRGTRRRLGCASLAHAGMVTLGIGTGGLAAAGAALLHVLGHALAKTVALLGLVPDAPREGEPGPASPVPSAPRRASLLGSLGALGLLGLPPTSLFTSGLAILAATFAGGHAFAAAVVVAASVVGLATVVLAPDPEAAAPGAGSKHRARRLPLVLLAAALVLLGLAPPRPVAALLRAATRAIEPLHEPGASPGDAPFDPMEPARVQ